METPKIFEKEYRFCLILWEHEPIKSSELVNLCREQLGWKPTTTYTVITRLAERGIVEKDGKLVRPLLSRKEAEEAAVRALLADTFEADEERLFAAMKRVFPHDTEWEKQ